MSRYTKQSRYGSKSYGNGGVQDLVRKVKALTEETKYSTVYRSLVNIVHSSSWAACYLDPDAPTATVTLFCPTVGPASTQRIGRQAKITSIRIRGAISYIGKVQAAAEDNIPFLANLARLILFIDTNTNGLAVNTNLLMDPTTTSHITNFQNIQYFGRFKVLKDVTFPFSSLTLATAVVGTQPQFATAGMIVHFKWTVKMNRNPLMVNFSGSTGAGITGAIADVVDNSIHMAGNTLYGGGTTVPQMQCQYTSRCTFKE